MAETLDLDRSLPVGELRRNSTAWLGVLCLIATEGSLFAYLLFSYAYAVTQHGPGWLPTLRPSFAYSLPGSIVLVSSSFVAMWGERGIWADDRRQALLGLGGAAAMGVAFVVLELLEWNVQPFTLSSRGYGSFYFTITGFHLAHVVVGVIGLTAVTGWAALGYFGSRRHAHIANAVTYWHFVDVVWVFVFCAFYLAPYLAAA
jgi:cytochrome c oxidase subunit 3